MWKAVKLNRVPTDSLRQVHYPSGSEVLNACVCVRVCYQLPSRQRGDVLLRAAVQPGPAAALRLRATGQPV